jgi:hypothetical protein
MKAEHDILIQNVLLIVAVLLRAITLKSGIRN